jgi:N-acetylglutamate synthase-like GNAT family acetyltransferase
MVLPGAQNSLFTTHLLDGLVGAAADADGFVRIFELFNYTQQQVRKAGFQRAIFSGQELDEDFAIAFAGTPASTGVSAKEPAFKEDAFISFSPADEDWVEKELLPRLEAAGVSVATAAQLPLGDYQVLAIERAVRECKRILVVVSRESHADRIQKFTNALASRRGVRTGQLGLVPLFRVDPETVPDLITSGLVGIDFSHGADERKWLRLCQSLRDDLPTI